MTEGEAPFLRSPGLIPLRFLLWINAAGAGIYAWLQPRGFLPGSRAWLEHQLIVPAFFLLSVAAPAAVQWRPRLALPLIAAVAGFWIGAGGAAALTGSTTPAAGMGIVALVTLTGLALLAVGARRAGEGLAKPLSGLFAGLTLAALFLACAWAPPASTRPSGPSPKLTPTPAGPPGFRVSIAGDSLQVASGQDTILLFPVPRFQAVADRGFWSLFQFRSSETGPWEAHPAPGGGLTLRASGPDSSTEARVFVGKDEVQVRAATTLHRELPAHLASTVAIQGEGDVLVDGVPWAPYRWGEPDEFLAFRRGKLELLRAARAEKGPFTALASWEPRDPTLRMGKWKVRVEGWAAQASLEESPTAGWGVSQGAVERIRGGVAWSLASTSVGRGWHAVRTAPGTYLLDIRVSLAPLR